MGLGWECGGEAARRSESGRTVPLDQPCTSERRGKMSQSAQSKPAGLRASLPPANS